MLRRPKSVQKTIATLSDAEASKKELLKLWKAYPTVYRRPILLKGYVQKYNPSRDYKTAKEPIAKKWTSPDYKPPDIDEVLKHLNHGGWVGYLVPPEDHVIDCEEPSRVAHLLSICRRLEILPPINKTNNGIQVVFSVNGNLLGGQSDIITRCGLPLTYRAAKKNYVILPPLLGRVWDNPDHLETPPLMPDEFYPAQNTIEDIVHGLAWSIGEAHRAGLMAGYDDIDAGLMTLLLSCNVPESLIHEAFSLVFLSEYDERRTDAMLHRTLERKEKGEPLLSTGSLIQTLKEKNLKEITGHIAKLQRITGASIRKRGKETPEIKIVLKANLPGLVDLVDDEGTPAFLMLHNDKLETHRAINDESAEGEKISVQPPGYEHLPFPLVPAKDIQNYFQTTDENIFEAVLVYLRPYAYLTYEQRLICSMYVFLTYLQDHHDIQYIPMLLFHAVPERGKTRTGKAMTYISFRGVHCVDLRETNLFRYSEDLKATLFLDIMDIWKKAERNESEDVLLQRYEKGATVARVLYPEKGAFKDTKYYSVFGPTLIASNESLHKILDSRCINFQMPNKPGYYLNPKPADGLTLKARLTAWRARNITGDLPAVEPIKEITGRLWDITKPLFQICLLVAPDRYEELIEAILNIATERKQEKQSSDDGKIVRILLDLSPDDRKEWDLATKTITEKFNKDQKSEWRKTEHWMGRKLRALGIKTRIIAGYSKALLNRDIFNTLTEQYGLQTL